MTDSEDGAVAENNTTIKWHLPYEPTEAEPSVQQHRVLETLVQPNSDSFAKPTDPADTLDISAGVEGIAGAVGAAAGVPGGPTGIAIGASLAGAAAGLANLEWTYEGNDDVGLFLKSEQWAKTRALDGAGGSATFQDDDHMTEVTWAFLNREDGDARLRMGLKKVQRWTRQQWKADHYETNGFHSSGWRLYTHVNNSIRFEPFWEIDPVYVDPNAINAPAQFSDFGLSDSPEEESSTSEFSGGSA